MGPSSILNAWALQPGMKPDILFFLLRVPRLVLQQKTTPTHFRQIILRLLLTAEFSQKPESRESGRENLSVALSHPTYCTCGNRKCAKFRHRESTFGSRLWIKWLAPARPEKIEESFKKIRKPHGKRDASNMGGLRTEKRDLMLTARIIDPLTLNIRPVRYFCSVNRASHSLSGHHVALVKF